MLVLQQTMILGHVHIFDCDWSVLTSTASWLVESFWWKLGHIESIDSDWLACNCVILWLVSVKAWQLVPMVSSCAVSSGFISCILIGCSVLLQSLHWVRWLYHVSFVASIRFVLDDLDPLMSPVYFVILSKSCLNLRFVITNTLWISYVECNAVYVIPCLTSREFLAT